MVVSHSIVTDSMVALTTKSMAKRKSGLHKTKRTAVFIPTPWSAIARKMAVKKQQPLMWHIVSLIGEAAKQEGLELPPYPWEEEFVIDEPKKKKD